jgi:hypothetical protein
MIARRAFSSPAEPTSRPTIVSTSTTISLLTYAVHTRCGAAVCHKKNRILGRALTVNNVFLVTGGHHIHS